MSAQETKLITGTIAPETKLTAQTNPESVSLDSSMTFHTGSREFLRITNEARLIIGEGLSKDEATQEVAKLLVAAFKERIQQMLALASDVQDEIATLQDLYASAKARAEKAEAENAVFLKRLDSIQKSHFSLSKDNAALLNTIKNIALLTANGDAERANWVALGILNNPRVAIDAAMKEASK